jgi:hypothetical protein
MASTTSSIAPSALGASSTRSYAPATALLDRVEEDLGFDARIDSEASSTIEQPVKLPHRHTALNGTIFIEILIKEHVRKQRTAWYWQHGAEYEVQNKPKVKGKNLRYWVCGTCKSFISYTVNGSAHINEHLRKVHSLEEGKTAVPRISIAEALQRHTP